MAEGRGVELRIRSAVTELMVIVAGVLIALSADQWWASRSDALTEATYLTGMLDDLSASRDTLESDLRDIEAYLSAASALSHLSRDAPRITRDSLVTLIHDALFPLPTWDAQLSTLDDLKNTGRLSLISDTEIRRALAEIDQRMSKVRAAESDLLQSQHQTVDPFLMTRVDLPAIGLEEESAPYMGPPLGIDHEPLLRDPQFQNVVAFRIVLLYNVQRQYRSMSEQLSAVSALIERKGG